MENITSPDLSPLTSLANTPRLLSPEPTARGINREEHETPSVTASDSREEPISITLQRPHLHPEVLNLSYLRRRRLRYNLPRDIVRIAKLCRELQQRANHIPLPTIPTVPSGTHLRSAGPVSAYEQAVAAAAAATEDVERIGDIKFQLELHAHELEVMRSAVFERFEDLLDPERGKVLRMQANCCFRDLKELEVEVNHRIWSARLRQPLQPLGAKHHVSLEAGRKRRKTGERREEQPSAQDLGVQDVPGMPLGPAMDMNMNMGDQFQDFDWPEFTDDELLAEFRGMEEVLLPEPVNWEEILRAEARQGEPQLNTVVKTEPEDDNMRLDDSDETETVRGDNTKEDVDLSEPAESIWSEESGGVDSRAMQPGCHPCDPSGSSWHPTWGRRQ
ncbi:hypothetical protein B0T20DRAFT_488959 [Sordaria brevicollis]|uniref:Uncharacterized protein n=1 Tax=Sordaria brevicollis TaxID=83679 RepID=A0AAE0P1Z8_SORBR|nr:hypothetical protein B0T20DRAFT_488959 [Sordaria brevicollis]